MRQFPWSWVIFLAILLIPLVWLGLQAIREQRRSRRRRDDEPHSATARQWHDEDAGAGGESDEKAPAAHELKSQLVQWAVATALAGLLTAAFVGPGLYSLITGCLAGPEHKVECSGAVEALAFAAYCWIPLAIAVVLLAFRTALAVTQYRAGRRAEDNRAGP